MIESEKCTIEKCDIFDFMAQHVGLSVLHPGGFEATSELANRCGFNEDQKIIDIACGKGTTSIYLAKRFGCKVIGIDFSERLIPRFCTKVVKINNRRDSMPSYITAHRVLKDFCNFLLKISA